MNLMRPGYIPPSRRQIGSTLIDEVYKQMITETTRAQVCMALNECSNVHNEPIVFISVLDTNESTYVIDSFDTAEKSHTSDYLTELAARSIKKCHKEYGCTTVRSFVMDNAANTVKM